MNKLVFGNGNPLAYLVGRKDVDLGDRDLRCYFGMRSMIIINDK